MSLDTAIWHAQGIPETAELIPELIRLYKAAWEPMPAALQRIADCRTHMGIYAQAETGVLIHDHSGPTVVESGDNGDSVGVASASAAWWTGPNQDAVARADFARNWGLT